MGTVRCLSLAIVTVLLAACSSANTVPRAVSQRPFSVSAVASHGALYFVDSALLTVKGNTAIITKPRGGSMTLLNVTLLHVIGSNETAGIPSGGRRVMVQPIEIAGGGAGSCAFGTGNATSFSSDPGTGASYGFTAGASGSYTITFLSGSSIVASASFNYTSGAHGSASYTGTEDITSARDSGPDGGGTAFLATC